MDLRRGLGLVSLVALLGCGGGGSAAEDGQCATDCSDTGGDTALADDGDDGGSTANADEGPDDGTTSGGDTGNDTGEPPSGQIPCEVQDFLSDNCWMCHSASPKFGAPMPLAEPTDFEVPSVSDLTTPVHAMVANRIANEADPMPETGLLPAEDRAVLETWIAQGRPLDPVEACEGSDETGEEPPNVDAPCDDPFVVTAHAQGSDDGFQVPLTDDLYQCFVVAAPFAAADQGTAWAPVIDDDRVVHHMLLLTDPSGLLQPGDLVPNCATLSLTSNMLMGWGPGSGVYEMPDEAGLELPNPGANLVLQVHYNNTAGYDDAVDSSGFAVCSTSEPRPNVAATLWLGTTDIDVGAGETDSATGACDTSGVAQPFTMLMSWPHMHQFGSQFVTNVERIGGGIDPVVTVPAYSFDSQIYYPHDPGIVVQPGDVLRTTCTYDNTSGSSVGFGEGTAEEMCFNFATVYPIDLFNAQNRQCLGGGLGFP